MDTEKATLIVQAIESVAVVGALIYAGLQIRESRKNAQIESAWQIFRELSEGNTRSSRSYIYQNRKKYLKLTRDGANLKKLSEAQWKHASQVSNSFDRVGFLVHKKLVPPHLLEGYKYIICRSWIVLEPFVLANRISRNEPTYQSYFEYLARHMFDKYFKDQEVNFMEDLLT